MIELLIKMALRAKKIEEAKPVSACLADEQLALYMDGGFAVTEREIVEKHLVECSTRFSALSMCLTAEDSQVVSATDVVDVVVNFFRKHVSALSNLTDIVPVVMPEPAMVRDAGGKSMQTVQFARTFEKVTGEFTIRRGSDHSADIRVFLHRKSFPLDSLRVNLIQNGKEVHSLLSEKGEVVFDSCSLGRYTIIMKRKKETLGKVTVLLHEEASLQSS